jgi:mono/diheme cytochrome c family protein
MESAVCRLQQMLAALMIAAGVAMAALSAVLAGARSAHAAEPIAPLPERLSDTGLYAPGSTTQIAADRLAFTPQYPLWSDGATKRRWLYLPYGTAIDASNPNAWEFPRGTRLWKEFSHGRRIETRFIERLADGNWRFATYVWNEAGTEATLAPERGVRALPVENAPGGRYAVPSRADCLACHDGAPVPVLGVSALQLSPERDPQAPHAEPLRPGDVDLQALVARRWLRNLPPALLAQPPRVDARDSSERAVLGYLHGNCGHCHNAAASGAGVPVHLDLAYDAADPRAGRVRTLHALLGESRFKPHDAAIAHVVVPGAAEQSVLVQRLRSRDARTQMPPLGTAIPDAAALAAIERWINLEPKKEP